MPTAPQLFVADRKARFGKWRDEQLRQSKEDGRNELGFDRIGPADTNLDQQHCSLAAATSGFTAINHQKKTQIDRAGAGSFTAIQWTPENSRMENAQKWRAGAGAFTAIQWTAENSRTENAKKWKAEALKLHRMNGPKGSGFGRVGSGAMPRGYRRDMYQPQCRCIAGRCTCGISEGPGPEGQVAGEELQSEQASSGVERLSDDDDEQAGGDLVISGDEDEPFPSHSVGRDVQAQRRRDAHEFHLPQCRCIAGRCTCGPSDGNDQKSSSSGKGLRSQQASSVIVI